MVSVGIFRKDINSFIQTVSERARPTPRSACRMPCWCSAAARITGGTPACPTLPDTTVGRQPQGQHPGRPARRPGIQPAGAVQLPAWRVEQFRPAGQLHPREVEDHLHHAGRQSEHAGQRTADPGPPTSPACRRDAHNLTLYYEDPKFSARVSAAHRSSYLLAVLGDVNGHDYTVVDGCDQRRLQPVVQPDAEPAPELSKGRTCATRRCATGAIRSATTRCCMCTRGARSWWG